MLPALTEDFITQRLQETYRPNTIAGGDEGREFPENVRLKCAAVLIPLAWWQGEWHLVFTRRTEMVEHHKGQVSFPGGGCEIGETTAEETALREAEEEIGLRPVDVRLLGRLNDFITITGFRITPVVGIILWPFQMRLEPAEVGRAFVMPLAWLADRRNWEEETMTRPDSNRTVKVIRYHIYDNEILWGATARITHNFLSILGLLPAEKAS